MPRPTTRAQTHDALGRTSGSRFARTKRCLGPRPGLERTTRAAVAARRGPPSPHRWVTHKGSGPLGPVRGHPGRLGLVDSLCRGTVPHSRGCRTPPARQGRRTARHGRATRPRVRLSAGRRDELSPETEQSPAGLRGESAQASARARGGIRAARGFRTRAVHLHGSFMRGTRHGREDPCKVRRPLRLKLAQ